MGPIDIKYHVISLVAVFLALGVGIIVGSNSNLIGTNTIIDRQNAIISRLEENYKEMRQETEETKAFLGETSGYVKLLESETIPALLEGKLDGFQFGIVSVGAFPPDIKPTDAVVETLKKAGAKNSFTLNIDESLLRETVSADPVGFLQKLADELLNGSKAANGESTLTGRFAESGLLASGDLTGAADGVVFILGENLDASFLKEVIVPLQLRMRELGGIISSLAVGENESYVQIFSRSALPLIRSAETLPGRMKAAAEFGKMYEGKKERGRADVQ
ncbi:MAG: copper transporter [bacterium]